MRKTNFIPVVLVLVLWVAGLEQVLLLPFLAGLYLFASLKNKSLTLSRSSLWFFAIAAWCLTSIITYTNFGLWLKFMSTFLMAGMYYNFVYLVYKEKGYFYIYEVMRGYSLFLFLFFLFSFFVYMAFPTFQMRTLASFIIPNSGDSYFLQSLSSQSFGALFNDYEDAANRFSGPMVSFSSSCMALILLSPFVVSIRKSSFRFFSLILIFLMILATGSRLGLLAFVLSMLVYALILNPVFMRGKAKNIFLILSFSFFVFIALMIFFSDYLVDYFENLFVESRSESSGTRFKIYAYSIENFSKHFWVGWGNSTPLEGSSQRFSAGTHSSYIAMLYQHGVIGLLIYVAFILYLVKAGINNLSMAIKTGGA
ncbi:O-antigen ligase, partial [Alcanivorax sp. HI0003]